MRAGIIGMGSYKPANHLTNKDLEKMVETSDEWIIERTGMKNRPISSPYENVYVTGAMAAERAIYSARINVNEVDAIIGCSNTDLFAFPDAGSIIQNLIGARKVPSFGLTAGCSAQLYGLWLADALVSKGHKNVLVVASDNLSTNVDYEDRGTCILLSDIASAFVVGPVKKGGILSIVGMADGNLGPLLYRISGIGNQVINYDTMEFSTDSITNRPYLVMDGNAVFKHAVRTMSQLSEKALKLANEELEKEGRKVITVKDIILVPHHANQRIIDAVVERTKIPIDNVYCIIKEIGNSSAGSVGYAFEEGIRKGKIKFGDFVMLDVFGAGLSGAAAVLEVTSDVVDYTEEIPNERSLEIFKKYNNLYGSILPTTVEDYEKKLIIILKERKELEKEIYPNNHPDHEEIPLNGNGLPQSARLRRANRISYQDFEAYKKAANLGPGYTLAHFILDHRDKF